MKTKNKKELQKTLDRGYKVMFITTFIFSIIVLLTMLKK